MSATPTLAVQFRTPKPKADFILENHFSILLLRPVTDAGRNWVEEYIGPDNGYQPYFPTVVVEPRYADDIITGIREYGLEVQ
jgi:hypothetical protein